MTVERRTFMLDTNVLLDFYERRRSGSVVSERLVLGCIERGVPMFVACHQLKDLFYCMQLSLKKELWSEGREITDTRAVAAREAAWGCVLNALELFEVVGADISDIWLADKFRTAHSDLEDNLVIAASVRGQATHLITNDQRLLHNTVHATSFVHAITPEEALALVAV